MLTERIAVAVAALTLTIAPSDALAQRGVEWVVTSPGTAAEVYNIDWPGGSLDDFLDGLDASTPHSFIYPKGAEFIDLQPFSITRSFPAETLRVVQGLVPGFTYNAEGGDMVFWDGEGSEQNLTRPWTYVVSLTHDAIQEAQYERSRFDLDFEGGTVAQYAAALQKAAGEQKIVVMPEAGEMKVSSVKLSNVTLGEVSRLLFEISSVNVLNLEGVIIIKPQQNSESIWRDDSSKLESATWSIEEMVGPRLPAEQLLGAIDTALALADGKAKVRFHRETGMLIARGPREELNLIENVLDTAAISADARRQGIDYVALIEKTEFQLTEQQIERELAMDQLKYMHQKLQEAEKLAEKGMLSDTELQHNRMELKQTEADLRKQELRVEELSRKLDTYRDKAKELQQGGSAGGTTS
ncbi:MAG: hypothetical protein RLN60_03070 [Phycisphaerales bacterium]